jgi:hypothetical protein
MVLAQRDSAIEFERDNLWEDCWLYMDQELSQSVQVILTDHLSYKKMPLPKERHF